MFVWTEYILCFSPGYLDKHPTARWLLCCVPDSLPEWVLSPLGTGRGG